MQVRAIVAASFALSQFAISACFAQTSGPATWPTTRPFSWGWPGPLSSQDEPGPIWSRPHSQFLLGASVLTTETDDTLGFLSLGYAACFTRRLSANFELDLAPGTLRQSNDGHLGYRMQGLAGIFLLRSEVARTKHFSLFAEGGIGGLHAHKGFPAGAAANNWIQAAGAGIAWRFSENGYLFLDARYARLSDHFLEPSPGKSFNGVQYTFGLAVAF